MKTAMRVSVAVLLGAGLLFSAPAWSGPSGAKALFDSGEGTTVGMSVNTAPARKPSPVAHKPVAPKPEKYVGISYQLMSLSDDGRMQAVNKNRVFKSGERVKIIARVNRAGYLTVLNRGTSGQTHVLYHEYVEPYGLVEIPKQTSLRFVGAPGREDIVLMLSDQPNPIALQAGLPAAGQPVAPPAGAYPSNPGDRYASAPSGNETAGRDFSAGYPPPPAGYPPPPQGYGGAPLADSGQSHGATMMASLDGAKSARGAKDLVLEDSLASDYAVVSPRQGYRPVPGGTKDLILESSQGTHYGVVPVSTVADGGMLTLRMSLRHR
ncbi:MAG: hypothetical protein ACOZB0_00840 [Pseudomonadota bacterium]